MTRGWSTRELAELAGTTLKTVRHYHDVGLLEEPERSPNGYKRYTVTHLIRLLRIRRLVELGMPLTDIAALGEPDQDAEQLFRSLDDELAASIERQQRMRDDLAAILRHRTLAELPPGFDGAAAGLSEADRAFLLISSRVFDPAVVDELRELHRSPRSEVAREFDALPADADEQTRQSLAERYAPEIEREQRENPLLDEVGRRAATGEDRRLTAVLAHGIVELHNPAQLDVLRRLNAMLFPRD
jgi:DNA-binding transcriptional MerR regulator